MSTFSTRFYPRLERSTSWTRGYLDFERLYRFTIDSAKAYPDALRRISYLDRETKKRFKFLTNNFTLPALTIARIYKCRWQVELFFETSTWCTPLDVITFQESIAMNRPLVGSLDGFARPRIVRRRRCVVSRVH